MDVKLQQGATTLFKQHNASIARAPISQDKLYKFMSYGTR